MAHRFDLPKSVDEFRVAASMLFAGTCLCGLPLDQRDRNTSDCDECGVRWYIARDEATNWPNSLSFSMTALDLAN